jgi:cell division protein FtsI/penicillin-binding protein 2
MLRSLLALAFVALGVRLFFIQVVDHAHYAELSVAQVRVNLTTTALRAGIYDRNGQILAVSRPTSLVIADDMQIKNPQREAEAMSPIIQVPMNRLVALLSKSHDGYVILNDKLNLNSGRKLAALNFPGVVVQNSSVRTYPNGPIATSVLGGTNGAGVGWPVWSTSTRSCSRAAPGSLASSSPRPA